MSDDPSAAERAARQRIRDPARAARWRAWWRGALAGLVVVALGLFALRQPLSDRLWPEARAQALRDRAALALAHGRLSETDGTGARELYEAALAIDPDRNEARTGLMRVAQAALTRAKVATTEGRYGEAHRDLQLALSLSVPRAQADAAEAQLREHEARHAGIERLLAQAAAARVQQHLDGGPDAALPIYQRILAMQPDRVEALEGRDDALSDLLQQASLALRHDDLLAAARLVAAARGYDAGHADLPGVEATLSGAIEQARRRAEGELRHGRPEAAASGFNTLLQIDPQDSFARHGVEHVAAFWAHRAERDAADFHFADASRALDRARTLAPDLMAVHNAAQAIARAQQASVALRAPTRSRRSERTVRELLAGAVAAERRGDLLTPPGDSAFDKLRAARALAPDDRSVRAETARLLPLARQCFERELRNNNLGRAGACLDARVALDGDGKRAGRDRRRLAQRWLAVGEEWLGAGNEKGAAAALDHAQSLDADTPGVAEFRERVRAARPR